jgi:pyruvate dehydrogenase E1 component beta subunit
LADRQLTYAEALREALREEMKQDPSVFVMGEDIAEHGGVFTVTKGLLEEFGPGRIRNTPISEAGFVGAAVGAAMAGVRPVAELMFIDLVGLAMDQLANQAAKARYMFGGKTRVPMVLRAPGGSGRSNAAHHSQSLEAWMVHVPGLYVVMPSTPYDAKGLLKTAIRSDNPVVFVEHKSLYFVKGPVPENEYTIPFGIADIKRPGRDLSIIATSMMVHRSLEAAEQLSALGIDAEVVDPRTLKPLDVDTLVGSVRRTGRVLIVVEACKTGSFASEIAATLGEEAFDYLDAPITRLAGEDVPIPKNNRLEKRAVPQVEDIVAAARELLND